MKLRLLILFSILGICSLASNAQHRLSMAIHDSVSHEFLNEFQSDFGDVLYDQITKYNIPLYGDSNFTLQYRPEDIRQLLTEIIEYEGMDEETFEPKLIIDTLILYGSGWESILWNQDHVIIRPIQSKYAYLKASDCIMAAEENPYVKKALHMLLMHGDQFNLEAESNKAFGQALIDSLQTQLNRSLAHGDLFAFDNPVSAKRYSQEQIDSLFNQKQWLAVFNGTGEIEDTEVVVEVTANEQPELLLFGTITGEYQQLKLDFNWMIIMVEDWDEAGLYNVHYAIKYQDLKHSLSKKEQLLLELLSQYKLDMLKY